jgi:hypothetical protein
MQPDKNKQQGMEITTFKLRDHSCAAFIAANTAIDNWLKRQPGFQMRRIAERPDGTVVDLLIWDTVADGRQAMTRLMHELADSPVHNMIDQQTVSWNVFPVQHQLG